MARPEVLCVYCRLQAVDAAWRPFCSERCRLADLGHWLSEGYRVPEETPREEPPADPPKEDT